LHAPKVAEILEVSVQAVWLWTHQYNTKGPKGLDRKGRGGRRWAFLSIEREAELLKPFIEMAKSGDVAKASDIRLVFEKQLRRKVSMPYIYRLLARHGWSRIIAQSLIKKSTVPDDFKSITRPWLRNY
jgi:transposase